jgi:hypothetical protein
VEWCSEVEFMNIWKWVTTSRYTRGLEAEVERLRADRDEARRQVWALVNSLVTTAGAPLPQEILKQAEAKAGAAQPAKPAIQRGKKSWHQRAMALEIRSARELQGILRGRGEANTEARPSGGRVASDEPSPKGD